MKCGRLTGQHISKVISYTLPFVQSMLILLYTHIHMHEVHRNGSIDHADTLGTEDDKENRIEGNYK